MTNEPLSDAARAALLAEKLIDPQFPRSARYDLEWQFTNAMGPNPLWLVESLTDVMEFSPGMRVLDLGCGKAITSIFLAKEFGAQVVAADLWIRPSENWPRIIEAGVEAQVMPLHAEAHDLKFADAYFHAIVSIDAYQYFGTDDLYLSYLSRFLKPGGRVGICVPSLAQELNEVPELWRDLWEPDYWCFHSPEWWHTHWSRSGEVEVERADLMPDGWRHWLRWDQLGPIGPERWREQSAGWVKALEVDGSRTMGFARVVARRPE
jgi:SAM-dependent methyltransferase